MPAAWTCMAEPVLHGTFPQGGLEILSTIFGVVQPFDRFQCPVCAANRQPGWMRSSEETEVARLAAQHQEA